jgi:hypothetical protein
MRRGSVVSRYDSRYWITDPYLRLARRTLAARLSAKVER